MASTSWGDRARNVKDDFEPVPVGQYNVRVDTAEFKYSSKGDPMFVVWFKIVDGPNQGRKLIRNMTLTDRSAGIFFNQMKALGLDTEFFDAINDGDEDRVCAALIDNVATVTVEHREWNGKTQSDVKAIKPFDGIAPAGTPALPTKAAAPGRPF